MVICQSARKNGSGSHRISPAKVAAFRFTRILRPGGFFGLGEPMHLDVPISADLAPIYTKGEGAGREGWAKCFATVDETIAACRASGFDILEAGNAPDGWHWWDEFSRNDPHCKANPEGEAKIIQ